MKKGLILIAAAGIVLVLLIALLMQNSGDSGRSARKSNKPSSRPERPDLEKFKVYENRSVESIIEAIKPTIPPTQKSAAATFVSSLPKAPYPFTDTKPANSIALRQFMQNLESGQLGEPKPVDRWRYQIANSALGKSESDIPSTLKLTLPKRNEPGSFPIKMVEVANQLEGPLVIGNFLGTEDRLEIVSHGGTKLWQLNDSGQLAEKSDATPTTNLGDFIEAADFDLDGDDDLFIGRRHGLPNSLLRNEGSGLFTDITAEAGVLAFSDTSAVLWHDIDHNGLIDILVGNSDHPFELYRQTSSGKFETAAWDLGLWAEKQVTSLHCGDVNRDGFDDVFISATDGDFLYYSLPASGEDNWRFLEAQDTLLPFFDKAENIYHTFDFDNDGDNDILIGKSVGDVDEQFNQAYESGKNFEHLQLFQNHGDGQFVDITRDSGLEGVQDVKGVVTSDFDRDGFEDIVAITGDLFFNRAFWNRNGLEFADISKAMRVNYLNAPEQIACIDLARDGSPDLLFVDLESGVNWLKPSGFYEDYGWVSIKLNPPFPGTRLSLVTRDQDWVLQPIHRTYGKTGRLSIGLGRVDVIEELKILPPHATKPKIIRKVKPNQILDIQLNETASNEG